MPNWCATTMKIKSSPDEISKIESVLTSAINGEAPFPYGTVWLDRILTALGMSDDEIDKSHIECRGYITYHEQTAPDEITIDMDSAWCPQFGVFSKMFTCLDVDPDVTFISTEPGCELYCSNDEEIIGLFYLYDSESAESYDFLTEDELESLLLDLKDHKDSLYIEPYEEAQFEDFT